jgi:hypothetical protein
MLLDGWVVVCQHHHDNCICRRSLGRLLQGHLPTHGLTDAGKLLVIGLCWH